MPNAEGFVILVKQSQVDLRVNLSISCFFKRPKQSRTYTFEFTRELLLLTALTPFQRFSISFVLWVSNTPPF